MPVKAKPLHVRFWPKVEKGHADGDCWKWKGAKTEHGYGVIGAGGRGMGVLKAPRASWMINVGPIPDGLFVLHKCDNPECCNPLHLFIGNQTDNMRDCSRKGRVVIPRHIGEDNNHAKLTETQVDEIRASHKTKNRTFGAIKLGEKYGVHFKTILSIVNHKTWKKNDNSIKNQSAFA